METTQPTPAPQLQLETGQQLTQHTHHGWQVGTVLTVVRFTPGGQAHCQARNLQGGCWAVKLKPLGVMTVGDTTPTWYEPGTYSGSWYKLLTPELEALAALSLKRLELDKLMAQLGQRSHLLQAGQLEYLLAVLAEYLPSAPSEPEIF